MPQDLLEADREDHESDSKNKDAKMLDGGSNSEEEDDDSSYPDYDPSQYH